MKRYTLGGYDAYMEEWPGGSWVSHEDAEQAERERDEANETCREKQAIIERMLESERQAVALLREASEELHEQWSRTTDGHNGRRIREVMDRIEAFLAGQPAPVKPVVDGAMEERACYALRHGKGMRAALVAALEGRT